MLPQKRVLQSRLLTSMLSMSITSLKQISGKSGLLGNRFGGFSVISLFLHKIPFLKPENTYDAVQLSISKFLIILGNCLYDVFVS